jgi:glycosyltransferase involved in cell wall biosynthesis
MDHLYICGSENPMYGQYIGIVNDKNLNTIYNSSKFVLLPSRFEGLGLPMIEAMMAGSIPITCNDNPTALELSPPEFICEPTESDFLNKIIELDENYEYFQKIALQYGEKYRELMNKNKIAENIINLYNKHNEGLI